MNKTTPRSQLPITYQTLNKTQTDNFRHQVIMKSSQNLSSEKSSNKNTSNIYSEGYEEKSIFIKKSSIDRTISVYQWRYKTCYPIVKPIQIKVKAFTGTLQAKRLEQNSGSTYEVWNLDENLLEVVVIIQKIQWKLSQIDKLPLPQIVYLFKQALVGFECLIDIFGLFQPTQNMIAVNSSNQWRFWISEDFTSNSKKQSQISQSQFLMKIIEIVQSKLVMSKTCSKLFNDIKKLQSKQTTFLNVLDITKKFIQLNKVMVSKKVFVPQTSNSRTLFGSNNLIDLKQQHSGKRSQFLQNNQSYTNENNKSYDSSSNLGMKLNTSNQYSYKQQFKIPEQIKSSRNTESNQNSNKQHISAIGNASNMLNKNISPRGVNKNNSFNNSYKPQQIHKIQTYKETQKFQTRSRSKSPIPIKVYNPQGRNNNEQFNSMSIKAPLKISQLYVSDLAKNNIQKRASFMLDKKYVQKTPQQYKSNTKMYKFNSFVANDEDYINESPRNIISYKQNLGALYKQKQILSPNRLFSLKPLKEQIASPKHQKNFVFDLLKHKASKNNKIQHQNLHLQKDIETKSVQYINSKNNNKKPFVEKSLQNVAYFQSPTKSNNRDQFRQQQLNLANLTEITPEKIKQAPQTGRLRQVNLIGRQTNRQRKLSEQIPKIKSLDELAKKTKKMCESTVLTAAQQKQKQLAYNNLKRNDIQNHSRNNNNSTVFGVTQKEPNGFNNPNNDFYNPKVNHNKRLQKKSQSKFQDEGVLKLELNLNNKLQRKKTAFAIIEQETDRKYSQQKNEQLSSPFTINSPFYHSEKPQIRISNVNNQTAQTLNQIKGSQNDHSINSTSKNQKNITPQNSDYSQQKKNPVFANSKGLIGQSNLSIFSCKTHQPIKNKRNNATQNKNTLKMMATSQDFANNQSSSENTSQQFLKSNNWNKKISGLFSDVASIKVLKQSGHFGDQTDFFQKDYLKDVKLQKLGKLGKQLKGSIISDDDSGCLNVPYSRQQNYKSISLIGEVKQDPYQNQPSILEHSTSMICQSKHNKDNIDHSFVEIQKSMRSCQSYEEQIQQLQQIQIERQQKVQTRNRRVTEFSNGGFSFQTQLYNIKKGSNF